MDPPRADRQQPLAGAGGAGAEDAMLRLEQRLGRASDAAERLIAEAAALMTRSAGQVTGSAGPAAAPGPRASQPTTAEAPADPPHAGPTPDAPPAAGWQLPSGDGDGSANLELDALLRFVHSLRELVPPDLQVRLAEALRELLLALRAVIDWYLERSEQRAAAPSEVQDIPIQ